jgi:hypothetical protein
MNCMLVVHLAKTVHLFDAEINTVSKRTKATIDFTHVTYEFHRVRSKWFLSLLHVQRKTVHLSFVKISTISKDTETSFHLTHITYEFHRLPKTIFEAMLY